ncbi:hypothetical protein CAP36_06590 [Chitinophagaceae bacterium IBVUCB2]|nr:hypothetical protein CAP36_06590 [Chitinophagaceae bacterium IBVUCB2]
MSDAIIKVEGLGKRYIISHEQPTGSYTALRDVISNKAKGVLKKKEQLPPKEEFWALKDVNFEIKKGQAVGIIGRNGAGKSTLLKVLSRITEPTTGRIEMNGRVASLLEVGTGFHPELTGRENIFLNGAILGMGRAEIRKKFDEIVEFSGVEKFLDTPVKRYSSGMYVRLAFAVAAHLEPEILVVDEVLAVGDAEFQKKCLGKMNEVSKNEGRTVIFVSHDIAAIRQLCATCVLLKNGQVAKYAESSLVVSEYLKNKEAESFYQNKNIDTSKDAVLKKIYLTNTAGELKTTFNHDEEMVLHFELAIHKKSEKNNLFITLLDQYKRKVASSESQGLAEKMTIKFGPNFLVRGDYSVNAFIHSPGVEFVHMLDDVCNFSIIDNGSKFMIYREHDYGNVFLNTTWIYQ